MAIKIEDLQSLLISAGIKDPAQRSAVIKAAQELEADAKSEREADKGPKQKNKFAIVVRGDAKLKEVLQAGWVVKAPESSDNSTIHERIVNAARAQNDGSKAKKMKLFKYSEFFMFGKRKFSKNYDVQVMNREPVEVIVLETEDIKFN